MVITQLKNVYCLVTSQYCNTNLAKFNKAVVEIANNFNLGVDEDGIEELLEVVTEELTNKELPEWEQECIAEAEAREQKTAIK